MAKGGVAGAMEIGAPVVQPWVVLLDISGRQSHHCSDGRVCLDGATCLIRVKTMGNLARWRKAEFCPGRYVVAVGERVWVAEIQRRRRDILGQGNRVAGVARNRRVFTGEAKIRRLGKVDDGRGDGGGIVLVAPRVRVLEPGLHEIIVSRIPRTLLDGEMLQPAVGADVVGSHLCNV